jgi:hypothetical protein
MGWQLYVFAILMKLCSITAMALIALIDRHSLRRLNLPNVFVNIEEKCFACLSRLPFKRECSLSNLL